MSETPSAPADAPTAGQSRFGQAIIAIITGVLVSVLGAVGFGLYQRITADPLLVVTSATQVNLGPYLSPTAVIIVMNYGDAPAEDCYAEVGEQYMDFSTTPGRHTAGTGTTIPPRGGVSLQVGNRQRLTLAWVHCKKDLVSNVFVITPHTPLPRPTRR
ncbi:hypothetical protein [Micromonospora sp. KC723]|uniref:hypothetical protein n=1 Tax=Micromonospora sp. KC723 TaxID=2530381 RepID=UPI0010518114|nr:hypothetical protein [Micromonospora sp. KC723]TDB78326.1 hypothetical protein E1165_01305 [Micromonospora sp. KC723]